MGQTFDKAEHFVFPWYSRPLQTILPIACWFSSFVPTWFIAMALARALEIPDDAPVKDQPYGWLWLVLLFITMFAFGTLGFICGQLLNLAIVRYTLGWSWAKIQYGDDGFRWLTRTIEAIDEYLVGPEWHEGEDPLFDPQLDRDVP